MPHEDWVNAAMPPGLGMCAYVFATGTQSLRLTEKSPHGRACETLATQYTEAETEACF